MTRRLGPRSALAPAAPMAALAGAGPFAFRTSAVDGRIVAASGARGGDLATFTP